MRKTLCLIILTVAVCSLLSAVLAEPVPVRWEFEDGTLLGAAKVHRLQDTGWVEIAGAETDGVTVRVAVGADGFYDLTINQAGIGGYKENYVLIDGEPIGNTVAEGLKYANHTLSHLWLTAGEHSISVTAFWGNVKLDYLELKAAAALSDDIYDVPSTLCNPDPSAEAQALMDWMCSVYGKKMISGQYLDEYQYGAELDAIAAVTESRRPAMVGLDLLNYSPAGVKLGSWPTSVDQAIGYWKKGYIITYCWHWIAPENYLDTTGNNWWGGFYTQNTTFSLAKAMNGEDPEGYEFLIRDMDAIAEQLKRLGDAGIPVLWRPLHEASGGWFWWGAFGPEPYIALYRLMYDRFTNVHGLNNLIWVWNGQSADWYPGDDVVDIIGEDIYAGHHAHDSQSAAFLRCLSYTGAKKLIILSECGCIPSPIKCARDQTMWGAWGVWSGEFVMNGRNYSEDYTGADTLALFYSQDNVITLADVPDFGRKDDKSEAEAVLSGLSYPFADCEVSGNASRTLTGADIRGNAEEDSAVLTVQVPESGSYRIVITQSGIGGHKENNLSVDGEVIGTTVVQGEEEEVCDSGTVWLEAGEHRIGVHAVWGWVSLRTLELIPEPDADAEQRYEFEDGELLGNVRIGMLGADGWVELASNDETDGVAVTVSAAEDGYYDLVILQAGIGGYKENYLAVDGERIANTVVQGTDWERCVTPRVWLSAGEHTVTVTCFWGWDKLDALILMPSEAE